MGERLAAIDGEIENLKAQVESLELDLFLLRLRLAGLHAAKDVVLRGALADQPEEKP